MDCQKFKENLYQYLDRELDESAGLKLEQHASNCPVCSLELEKEKKFAHVLKAHLIKEPAPFALRESIVDQLEGNTEKFSWTYIFKTRFAPALALLAVVLIVFAHQQGNSLRPFPVFSEAFKNHLEYLRGEYPLEFQTSDMSKALEWFQGKTDFAVMAPHLSLDKVKLVGGRIMHLKDKKAAYFLMQKDGYKISGFYTNFKNVEAPKASAKEGIEQIKPMVLVQSENGYHTVFCFHPDGTACILVSDMPMEDFVKILA